MVSRSSKLILIDAVKKTDSHNKRKEEREMWQQRTREQDRAHSSGCQSRSLDVTYRLEDLPSGRKVNKWAAELLKYEESLGDERWGHGGYKQLYPDEFSSSSCELCAETSDMHVSSRRNGLSNNQTNRQSPTKKKLEKRKISTSEYISRSADSLAGREIENRLKRKKRNRREESPSCDSSSSAATARMDNPSYTSYYQKKESKYKRDRHKHKRERHKHKHGDRGQRHKHKHDVRGQRHKHKHDDRGQHKKSKHKKNKIK